MTNWKTCKHEWSDHITIREPTFCIGIGSEKVCKLCGAIEFESWCETRTSGGTPRIYPPKKENI